MTTRIFVSALALSAMAMTFASPAYAYHPLITDDTGTQGQGNNQLEIGYDYTYSHSAGITDIGGSSPITYTLGITDTLDIFIGSLHQWKPGKGWGNAVSGAKWRFHENDRCRCSLARRPEVLLPVSAADEAKGLGYGKLSYDLSLVFSQQLDFGEVHINLAAYHDHYDSPANSDRKKRYRLSIAPVWTLIPHWKIGLDGGLTTDPDSTHKALSGFAELGVVYTPSDRVDLSFGLIRDAIGTGSNSTVATFLTAWHF